MRRTFAVAAAALVITTAACSAKLPDFEATSTSDPSVTTGSSVTTESSVTTVPTADPTIPDSTTSTEAPPFVPQQLADLEIQAIAIVDGERLWNYVVAVAATQEQREQGLMNVADLEDLDGMLFVFDSPTTTGFWMENVILPLDIAFFGEDLMLVDSFTMPLCTIEDCPTFPPAGAFQYAVEALESEFAGISPDAMLILNP
jgi:uncharacterized membrane protein (UPF0127 family)